MRELLKTRRFRATSVSVNGTKVFDAEIETLILGILKVNSGQALIAAGQRPALFTDARDACDNLERQKSILPRYLLLPRLTLPMWSLRHYLIFHNNPVPPKPFYNISHYNRLTLPPTSHKYAFGTAPTLKQLTLEPVFCPVCKIHQ